MSKLYRYLVAGAITAVVLFLVWYFSNVVAYILVSAVLAIIGKPLTDLLSGLHVRRTRFPRSLAALCTLLAIWVVVVGVFWLFVPIVFQKIREFSSLDVPQIIQSFQEPLMSLESFIRRVFSISESEFSLVDAISEQIKPLLDIGVINNLLSSIVTTVGDTVIAAFSISFITFFFLKESHLFTDMVVIMFPKKYEPNITRALDSVTHLLIRYFTGIVAESSIMTLIVSLGLLMLGFSVHNALVIGLIVGLSGTVDRRGSGYFHRCGRNCGGRRVDGRACDARGRNDSGRSGYRQLRSATGALLQSGESPSARNFSGNSDRRIAGRRARYVAGHSGL